MSQFIKLTSKIINKNLISTISIKPNKYFIYTMEHNVDGLLIFGTGIMHSYTEKIEICEKDSPHDYKIISKWIETI
jgi:hypothetical protein